MAPRATIQNQKNSTLKLFQPAEIVPKKRQFETKINGETSNRFHIHSISVYAKGAFLVLFSMYVLYTSDLPAYRETTLSTFADDTSIFATHEDPTKASLIFKNTYT
jgi:hypothetical protein